LIRADSFLEEKEGFARAFCLLEKERERAIPAKFERENSMAHDPEDEILNEKNPRPLDEDDIALLKT